MWKTLWITLLKGCFKMQIDKDELLNKAKELLRVEMTEIAFIIWFVNFSDVTYKIFADLLFCKILFPIACIR